MVYADSDHWVPLISIVVVGEVQFVHIKRFMNGESKVGASDYNDDNTTKAIPLFFVYCRMRFLILGRSVEKETKKKQKKIGKGVWN